MPAAAPAGGPMLQRRRGLFPSLCPAPGAPIPAAPPMPGAYPGAPAPYAAAPAYTGGPVPVAVHNPTGKATMALVFGLLSALGAVAFPVGIVFSILGIVNSRTGMKSTAKGMGRGRSGAEHPVPGGQPGGMRGDDPAVLAEPDLRRLD